MIRKLRWRFVLINMLLVLVVLFALFSAICISSFNSLKDDSYEAMHRELNEFRRYLYLGEERVVPANLSSDNDETEPHIAICCIWIGEDQDWSKAEYWLADEFLSGSDLVFVAGTVLQNPMSKGNLDHPQHNVRWEKEEAFNGTIIVVADRSNEIAVMTDLTRNTGLLCAAAALAFWMISILLVRLMTKPVETAWDQQRQFIADASHELKTPLTVVLANTQILKAHSGETIESQKKWLTYIEEEAVRMKQLVEDMLFLARSDASREKLISSRFDASELVTSCLLSFEPIAFEKGVMIENDVSAEIFLKGDPGQFRQLCAILMDNACKYVNTNGAIKVQFALTLDRIRLTVFNTGTPIPKESLPHLFERFYRADSARTREEGGYGLGLSIAEKISKNFHGKISAESHEDGNSFIVSLPHYE